jgi:hypothetical protein
MKKPATAFISYSHRDEGPLSTLLTHLAMLRREGSIAEWIDQKILAGGEIDKEVSRQLENCDLFLPLLSPDFLASNYCYETEMRRAIARHEAGTLQIVPIVVEPCDWKASPLKRFKALPRDGKPVADWTNKNNAYLDIVTELRRLIDESASSGLSQPERPGQLQSPETTRKYRVKRDFDEIDRRDFRKTAFETIRAYFESATAELNVVDLIKARFEALGGDGFTCTVVNKLKQDGTAHITVYVGGGRSSLGDITYSFQERAEPNTANGWFAVECDDYDLYLASNDFASHGSQEKRLSPKAAAAYLWERFLERAGIDHE